LLLQRSKNAPVNAIQLDIRLHDWHSCRNHVQEHDLTLANACNLRVGPPTVRVLA
jgi:hypothetical protein